MVELIRPRFLPLVRVGAVVAVMAGTLALSACAGDLKPTTSPTPSTSSSPVASATPTPTATTPATPVTLTCPQLLTPQQLYAYNPNFGTDPGYAPTSGSLAATAVADQGVACGWLNQTSGDKIEIAVSKPPASQLDTLKNSAVTTSRAAVTYGVPDGYFALRGATGEVQIFTGNYWIIATSTAFQEPGDNATLMQDVMANLPKD